MSSDQPPAQHLRGLDGLRAVAILLVILWHTTLMIHFPPARLGALRPFVFTCWAGVDLFFALSGFLITTLLLREEKRRAARDGSATFSLRNFYVRRALRILPVFYATFALLVLGFSRSEVFRTVRVAAVDAPLWPYALFFNNYYESYALLSPQGSPGESFQVFWSLCVEEHFYLLWPITLWLVRGRRGRIWLAAAACVALPLLRYAVISTGAEYPHTVHIVSHYRFDSLLWGALAALSVDLATLGDRARRLLLAGAALLCAWLVATTQLSVLPRGTPLGSALGFSALAILSTLIVLECARRPDSLAVRALEARPLRLIGRLSFAMYLLHFPMIDLARRIYYPFSRAATLPNLAAITLLTATLSAAVAGALHVAVERPFLRLKDRYA